MPTYVELSTPGRLLSDAAASFELVLYYLDRDADVQTGTTHANHAYRDLAEQERLFRLNYQSTWTQYATGKVDARTWPGHGTWYRKWGRPSTAVPGTSNHGKGNTVDFQDLGDYDSKSWKRANPILQEFGWNNEEGRKIGEWWHWTYVRADDKHYGEEIPEVELSDRITISNSLPDLKAQVGDTQSVSGAMQYASASLLVAQNVEKAVAALAKKVDNLSVGGATIDYAKLAKAVNDDAAARMKE